ncbi:transcription factor DICHOTOMA [Trifolium repens]|nr:transcription factor DICHOTOMA [Trifolium repens]
MRLVFVPFPSSLHCFELDSSTSTIDVLAFINFSLVLSLALSLAFSLLIELNALFLQTLLVLFLVLFIIITFSCFCCGSSSSRFSTSLSKLETPSVHSEVEDELLVGK